jgi:hypothetical protein
LSAEHADMKEVKTMAISITTVKELLESIGDQEIVLMPLAHYNALLDKLEELEDIRDMLESLKEPARPFEEYLAGREDQA